MKRQLAERFNQEVENHRKALLYYARKCDWETFHAKAGRLFDYLESIEFRELERRFYSVFSLVLVFQVLASLKNAFMMSSIAVSSFELYFYVDYRMYVDIKTRCYRKRREIFIREI